MDVVCQLTDRIFDPKFAHRETPDRHGIADSVDIALVDLGTVPQWPFVVDEAFRLLQSNGTVRFRLTESPIAQKHAVARLFAALSATPPRLIDVEVERGSQVLTVDVARHPTDTTVSEFTFGIVSDGRNLDRLVGLIDSVRGQTLPSGASHELLVCGPGDVLKAANLGPDVVVVPEDPTRTTIPWITGKKNRLAEVASHPNLILSHDRYRFPADFLVNFTAWGGDYSFLNCSAVSPGGERFPDWIAMKGDGSTIEYPIGLLDYLDFHPGAYSNGGLIVAKRETLLQHPFSEILWWGEAEDVELSHRLRDNGHILRLAPSLQVMSLETTRGYVDGFVPLRASADRRPSWRTAVLEERSIPDSKRAPHTVAGMPSIMQHLRASTFIVDERMYVEITASPGCVSSFHLVLLAKTRLEIIEITVGDEPVTFHQRWSDDDHRLIVSLVTTPQDARTMITVRSTDDLVGARLGAVIEAAHPCDSNHGELVLDRGWWPAENWGAWMSDRTAAVLVSERALQRGGITMVAPPSFVSCFPVAISIDGGPWTRSSLSIDGTFVCFARDHLQSIENLWHVLTIRSDELMPIADTTAVRDDRLLGAGLVLRSAV
jgi:hypothetical protein